jgi:hypothetical protein
MSAIVAASTFATGCATIMGKGGPENLSIKTVPEKAKVVIYDEKGDKVFEGESPTIVSLEKKKGFFKGKSYTVVISKPGYKEKTVKVNTTPNGWYILGNLVFGDLIGWLIVDPLTGAMWTFDTKDINVNLENTKTSDSLNLRVVTIDEVPPHLRSKLVKISD